jgi:hypothetical protein
MRNHAVADAAAGKAFRLGATQNTKNVVLSACESGRFQQLLGLLSEGVGGLQESDEKPVLEGDKKDGILAARLHDANIVVVTMIVKRKS